MELYAVRERRGGPWDWSRGLREQAGFADHARFMDDLVEAGFILLGGPLEGDREALLLVSAPSADAIRERLAADPWLQDGTLSIVSIERWTILLDGLHQAVAEEEP
ncbi:MAG: YciI family protein [Streptosporangiaceae bacterium]